MSASIFKKSHTMKRAAVKIRTGMGEGESKSMGESCACVRMNNHGRFTFTTLLTSSLLAQVKLLAWRRFAGLEWCNAIFTGAISLVPHSRYLQAATSSVLQILQWFDTGCRSSIAMV